MPAFVERALADAGVGGEPLEHPRPVVRPFPVLEDVPVDEAAGLVVGAHPGLLDVGPALEDGQLHGPPQRGVGGGDQSWL
jgi:hypothetical protein